jgi:hypothetical protein
VTTSRAPSIVAVVGALVLIASGVLVALLITERSAPRTLSGTITWVDTQQARFDRDVHGWVNPRTPPPNESSCEAAMPAVALSPGQDVMVYDGSGAVIGHGALGTVLAPVPEASTPGDRGCGVSFAVSVPRADGYTVEVGPHRATYASRDLDVAGWDIQIPVAPN